MAALTLGGRIDAPCFVASVAVESEVLAQQRELVVFRSAGARELCPGAVGLMAKLAACREVVWRGWSLGPLRRATQGMMAVLTAERGIVLVRAVAAIASEAFVLGAGREQCVVAKAWARQAA